MGISLLDSRRITHNVVLPIDRVATSEYWFPYLKIDVRNGSRYSRGAEHIRIGFRRRLSKKRETRTIDVGDYYTFPVITST